MFECFDLPNADTHPIVIWNDKYGVVSIWLFNPVVCERGVDHAKKGCHRRYQRRHVVPRTVQLAVLPERALAIR